MQQGDADEQGTMRDNGSDESGKSGGFSAERGSADAQVEVEHVEKTEAGAVTFPEGGAQGVLTTNLQVLL